jgi:hypothetical protein
MYGPKKAAMGEGDVTAVAPWPPIPEANGAFPVYVSSLIWFPPPLFSCTPRTSLLLSCFQSAAGVTIVQVSCCRGLRFKSCWWKE